MLFAVTCIARWLACSAVSAADSPEKVLNSHRLVEDSGARGGGHGLSAAAIGFHRADEGEHRLPDRALAGGEQVTVGLRERAHLSRQREEGFAVLAEQIAPGRRCVVG